MYIYKTTNIVNNKIYIGKAENQKESYLGSGYILKKAIKKYGKSNFEKEILEHCTSRDMLNNREIYWIKAFNSTNPDIGYNITSGGTGGNTFLYKNKDEMNIIKEKISKAGKNKSFTEEHRKKLSESAAKRKGNKPNPHKGKKIEDFMDIKEAKILRKRLSSKLKGKKLTKEHKEKLKEAKARAKESGILSKPKSKEHIESLKKSFKKRDAAKKAKTDKKYLEKLDHFLLVGVDESNYDEARKAYKKAKYRSLDISKYNKLIDKFKIISKKRRSNRKKNK